MLPRHRTQSVRKIRVIDATPVCLLVRYDWVSLDGCESYVDDDGFGVLTFAHDLYYLADGNKTG